MIFYAPQFALGNIIQTTPAVRWLQRMEEVTLVTNHHTEQFIKAVFPGIPTTTRPTSKPLKSVNPGKFKQGGDYSEVVMNLNMAGCLPQKEDRIGFCGDGSKGEQFDILFCNGYNKTKNKTDWAAKTYPHWKPVVASFPDLKMGTVGLPDEHIAGTIDRTGIGLAKTFALLRSARLVVTSDTGLYHAASAMGVPVLVLFTMTDTTKNHDPIFHRTAKIIRRGLPCQPCQLRGTKFWLKNQPICGWACRDIPSLIVINEIKNALEEADGRP